MNHSNKPIINVAFTRFSQFVIKNFLLNPMKYKEHSLHLSFEQSSDVIFVGLNLYLWSRRFECSFFFNQSLLDSSHLLCCVFLGGCHSNSLSVILPSNFILFIILTSFHRCWRPHFSLHIWSTMPDFSVLFWLQLFDIHPPLPLGDWYHSSISCHNCMRWNGYSSESCSLLVHGRYSWSVELLTWLKHW